MDHTVEPPESLADSTVSIEYMHRHWAGIVGRVRYGGERYLITSHGKPAFAIVPVSDLPKHDDFGDFR